MAGNIEGLLPFLVIVLAEVLQEFPAHRGMFGFVQQDVAF